MLPIGIDLDGVLIDSLPAMVSALAKQGVEADLSRYDLGASPQTFALAHDYAVAANLFWESEPYPFAAKAMYALKQRGFYIIYTTSRRSWTGKDYLEKRFQDQTMHWLHEWNFPVDQIHFTLDKPQSAQEKGMKWMVEDSLEIAQDFLKRTPRIPCFLIDRTWNRGDYVPFGEYDYPHRLSSLEKLIDLLDEAEQSLLL